MVSTTEDDHWEIATGKHQYTHFLSPTECEERCSQHIGTRFIYRSCYICLYVAHTRIDCIAEELCLPLKRKFH